MRPLLAFLLMLPLLATLTACGWHLRGSTDNLESLGSLWVQNVGSPLGNSLQKALRSGNAVLAESAESADFVIQLSNYNSERQIAAYSANGNPEEYLLSEEVNYLLIPATGDPLAARKLQVERSYGFDPNALLSKDEEEQELREVMRNDLVRQILLQLQVLSRQAKAAPLSESAP